MKEYSVGDIVRLDVSLIGEQKTQLIYKSQSTKGDFRARVLEGELKGMSIWAHGVIPNSQTIEFVEHGVAPIPYIPKVGMTVSVLGKCCDTQSLAGCEAVITKCFFKENYPHKIEVDIFKGGKRIRHGFQVCTYCTEVVYPQMKLFNLSDLVKGE